MLPCPFFGFHMLQALQLLVLLLTVMDAVARRPEAALHGYYC